jgi:hypothetical protein
MRDIEFDQDWTDLLCNFLPAGGLGIGLRMDCGYCGYPQQSTKFVDVDWVFGGLDPRLVDCGLDWMDLTN